MEENEVVKEADEELKKLQMDEFWEEVEIRQRLNALEKRYNEKKAKERAISETKIETVKRMLENGIDIAMIMKITEMSEEEINKIKEEMQV